MAGGQCLNPCGNVVRHGRFARISLIERVMIREWLMWMDTAFAPVATWLPWGAL